MNGKEYHNITWETLFSLMYEEGIEFYQYLCIKKYRKICYSKIVIFVVFKNFKVLGSIKVMEICILIPLMLDKGIL